MSSTSVGERWDEEVATRKINQSSDKLKKKYVRRKRMFGKFAAREWYAWHVESNLRLFLIAAIHFINPTPLRPEPYNLLQGEKSDDGNIVNEMAAARKKGSRVQPETFLSFFSAPTSSRSPLEHIYSSSIMHASVPSLYLIAALQCSCLKNRAKKKTLASSVKLFQV